MSERESARNCHGCRRIVWSVGDNAVKCDYCGTYNDPRVYAPSGEMWRDLFERVHDAALAWDVADRMSAALPDPEATIATMKERGHHRQATLARERLDAARRTT
jgi:LSD1 subclass zinc finger protein